MNLNDKIEYYAIHLWALFQVFYHLTFSKDRLRRWQNRQLSKIIKYSYEHAPYYRMLFDSIGLRPEEVKSSDDLKRIPILTKEEMRKNYPDRILSDEHKKLNHFIHATSGSSGVPLVLKNSFYNMALYRCSFFRQTYGLGISVFDTIAYIRPMKPDLHPLERFGIYQRKHIPALTLSPREQVEALLKMRPEIIKSYPSMLNLIEKEIDPRDAEELGLKFILSESEKLDGSLRVSLEKTFHCKVFDDYACWEINGIASECRLGKYHVNSDNVIVEVVDESGKTLPLGVEGNIVITCLNNKIMPYIRYDLRDCGVLSNSACSCGNPFPIIENILGRADDILVLADDSKINPQVVRYAIKEIDGIMEFQAVQFSPGEIEVSVVVQNGYERNDVVERVLKNLELKVQGEAKFIVTPVEVMKRTERGKLRSIVNYIGKNDHIS